jgi:hypothetical protein
MPINYQQQISPQGTPNRKGLEVYKTETIYSGEYVNWGNALTLHDKLASYSTGVSGYGDSVSPIDEFLRDDSIIHGTNVWHRFNTVTGTQNYLAAAPTSSDGYFNFFAASNSGLTSYAGLFQKLSTTVGTEYEIQVTNSLDTQSSVLYIETHFPRYDISGSQVGYKVNSRETVSYPNQLVSQCITTSTFTAKTANDYLVIYLTIFPATLTSTTATVKIPNISIKEKTDILVPIYSEDRTGNAQKILRRETYDKTFNT